MNLFIITRFSQIDLIKLNSRQNYVKTTFLRNINNFIFKQYNKEFNFKIFIMIILLYIMDTIDRIIRPLVQTAIGAIMQVLPVTIVLVSFWICGHMASIRYM
ncbi:hypothetical protein BpHYR1_046793 [Brachionus plicatilis]|uniref:Uncharacterized protein n=1 Tax=Brachionus plicatilis TaxID=10195 RepID=A0A3M7QPY3_BRAPC|nr:hypothetical protein BpHYR1_046793 [Brachionus plicatilis]